MNIPHAIKMKREQAASLLQEADRLERVTAEKVTLTADEGHFYSEHVLGTAPDGQPTPELLRPEFERTPPKRIFVTWNPKRPATVTIDEDVAKGLLRQDLGEVLGTYTRVESHTDEATRLAAWIAAMRDIAGGSDVPKMINIMSKKALDGAKASDHALGLLRSYRIRYSANGAGDGESPPGSIPAGSVAASGSPAISVECPYCLAQPGDICVGRVMHADRIRTSG